MPATHKSRLKSFDLVKNRLIRENLWKRHMFVNFLLIIFERIVFRLGDMELPVEYEACMYKREMKTRWAFWNDLLFQMLDWCVQAPHQERKVTASRIVIKSTRIIHSIISTPSSATLYPWSKNCMCTWLVNSKQQDWSASVSRLHLRRRGRASPGLRSSNAS